MYSESILDPKSFCSSVRSGKTQLYSELKGNRPNTRRSYEHVSTARNGAGRERFSMTRDNNARAPTNVINAYRRHRVRRRHFKLENSKLKNSARSSDYFERSQIQTAVGNSQLVDYEIPNDLVISENISCNHGEQNPNDTPTSAIEFNVGFTRTFGRTCVS